MPNLVDPRGLSKHLRSVAKVRTQPLELNWVLVQH